MTIKAEDFDLIVAVNHTGILADCLERSPDVAAGRLSLTAIHGASNMAQAYNDGLNRTSGKFAILAHQDVYLPKGWLDLVIEKLTALEADHPDWMVAGPYGVKSDGNHVGRVWDVSLRCELGSTGFQPARVASLDELLLILRRNTDYRFDTDLPHFHMYGTDLVQSCLASGKTAWAIEIPLVHNSQLVASLGGGYTHAYRYMRRKWRQSLPIPTTVVPITRNPIPLARAKFRRRHIPARDNVLLADSVEIARKAGYEVD